MRLLITGSEGLVGERLARACLAQGHDVVRYDLVRKLSGIEDICDETSLTAAVQGCDGIIHLAAISRVAWGEMRPDLCHKTNVTGTKTVVDAALTSSARPWLLFASSREVYGNPIREKVLESDPVAPVNVYGKSKAEGEALIREAREAGLQASIIRLSNVYGGRRDHPDRAVPSLVTCALSGQPLVITGGDNYFDFVHVDDCVTGLMTASDRLASSDILPPIHLTTGVATSLRELAHMACEFSNGLSQVEERPSRPFDVAGFCGSPELARQLLGWQSTINLPDGLAMLASDIRQNGPLAPVAIADVDTMASRRSELL